MAPAAAAAAAPASAAAAAVEPDVAPGAASAQPRPAASTAGRLAAEVALLDRARAALRANNVAAARAALAAYHQQFPSGDLDAEADAVTIEYRIAAGDHAEARALGRAFLARFPRSPLAQRVRSLLERLPD